MKNIIVTGTSRGIGMEVVLQLAKQGHNILAVSRTFAEEFSNHNNITFLKVDITIPEDLEKVKEFIRDKWQSVDILINNAGAIINKPFEEISAVEFEYIYKVNVFGVASMIQNCLAFMSKGSHVVTVSSMGGIQGSMKFPGLAAYSSSKGAVVILTELLAEEYKDKGISFNVLALGAVQTEMLEEAFPGYIAPIKPNEMAEYISDFSQTGNKYFNGKVLQVSSTTP